MYQYRRPPKPTKPKIPKILYLVLAIVLLVSAAVIVNYLYEQFSYNQGRYAIAADTPTPHQAEPVAYYAAPTPSPAPILEEPEYIPAPIYEPAPEPTPTPAPRVPRQEFLDHRAHYNNDDIVGHIWIPNTTVNYLVPQGIDNDFYLYHDLRGREFMPGSIYLDYLADIHTPGDQNWVIYGHNTARNHKFHAVRFFLNEEFFHNNRYIYFSTIYADYVFEVFSVYVAHISFQYHWNVYDDWEYKINTFANISRFDAGIPVSAEDRILTLSTCENSYVDNRIVVHAVLISETFPHLDLDEWGVGETVEEVFG